MIRCFIVVIIIILIAIKRERERASEPVSERGRERRKMSRTT